jgi:branched-chain amino acid transport system substrate-binding protein
MKTPRFLVPRSARRMLALFALAAAAGCNESGTIPRVPNEVVLGGVFSLTGNWSSLGVNARAAMELAVEDVNLYSAGRGVTFRADVRDTRLDPAAALAAVQSLHKIGVQVVLGPQSSAELAVLKPYVDANPMLVVSPSSTAGSLAVSGDRIFRFTPDDGLEGVAVSALMWDDGIRAVVPIWRADAGNQGLHSATAARFTAKGGMMWAGMEYAATAANYAAAVASIGTQVRQALATRPPGQVAVYLAGFDEVADVFAVAAHDPVLASRRAPRCWGTPTPWPSPRARSSRRRSSAWTPRPRRSGSPWRRASRRAAARPPTPSRWPCTTRCGWRRRRTWPRRARPASTTWPAAS